MQDHAIFITRNKVAITAGKADAGNACVMISNYSQQVGFAFKFEHSYRVVKVAASVEPRCILRTNLENISEVVTNLLVSETQIKWFLLETVSRQRLLVKENDEGTCFCGLRANVLILLINQLFKVWQLSVWDANEDQTLFLIVENHVANVGL